MRRWYGRIRKTWRKRFSTRGTEKNGSGMKGEGEIAIESVVWDAARTAKAESVIF